MAQLINITSEALQATIRRLLPSQQGFGEDLQATNVVTPIIDLTPTAEGSQLPLALSQALSFGNQFVFEATNNTDAIATSPGFFRITGTSTVQMSGNVSTTYIEIDTGLATKEIWSHTGLNASGDTAQASVLIDLVVFLDTGETLQARTDTTQSIIRGSARQIADRYGNIGNPVGFTFE